MGSVFEPENKPQNYLKLALKVYNYKTTDKMNNEDKKKISRRDFFKIAGAAGAVTTGLAACGNKRTDSSAVTNTEVPTDAMTYRTLTGDRVSLLGYGCMRWPMKDSPDGKGQVVDQEEVNRLVDYALAHGVNYFDTAPPYCQGLSEEATGIALSRHPRNSYYIATKMSNHRLYGAGLRGKELYDASVEMYRNSFKSLRTDYFDYYLFHILGTGAGMEEMRGRLYDCGIADFILKEKEAGRIRKLGFSFHGDVKVFDYMLQESGIPWDFVQIQLNYLDWRHASEMNVNAEYLYGELAKRNIPAVIMEPLLGGRLSKVHDHIVTKLKQREPEHSVASWAFRFSGSFPDVLTVLSGMTYMEHLQDNLRTYSPLQPLTDEEFRFLQETADLMAQYQTIPCNDCNYCMPCPYGLDIPGVLLHYNKCINEGHMPKSRQDDNYREARRAFLIGYDRSVPRLRQASHCIGCAQCNPHCPQGIDIPKEMQRIDHFVEQLKQNNL